MTVLLLVLRYYILTAYYSIVEWFGGPVVLLTDPRWKDDLHLDIDDYGDF